MSKVVWTSFNVVGTFLHGLVKKDNFKKNPSEFNCSKINKVTVTITVTHNE